MALELAEEKAVSSAGSIARAWRSGDTPPSSRSASGSHTSACSASPSATVSMNQASGSSAARPVSLTVRAISPNTPSGAKRSRKPVSASMVWKAPVQKRCWASISGESSRLMKKPYSRPKKISPSMLPPAAAANRLGGTRSCRMRAASPMPRASTSARAWAAASGLACSSEASPLAPGAISALTARPVVTATRLVPR